MIVSPNLRSHVPDAMRSPYYSWFVELGYPNLDIVEEGYSYWKEMPISGRWHIIEFYRSPVIPHLTPWNFVLRNIENEIPTRGFVEKQVHALDLRRKEIWDRETARTREVERDHAAMERHKADTLNRAYQSVVQNPDLMERVARRGSAALDTRDIFRHIPNHYKRV